MKQRIPTIGVFDSGVGGLTVLKALLTQASAADYLYLGDTARLPYGSKSQATVARYAVSSAHFLVEQGAEALVIACNTASALALDALRAAVEVPVIGVIETGATAALELTDRGCHGDCDRRDGREPCLLRRVPRTRPPRHREGMPAARAAGGGGVDRPSSDP